MKKLEQILVGVDFSEASRAALAEAVRLASGQGARLDIVHVATAEEVEEIRRFVDVSEEGVLEDLVQRVRAFSGDAAKGLEGVGIRARIGHPYVELVAMSEELSADLLVMGASGSGERRNRAGMIATKCVRHAPLTVLLVRARHQEPFHRVVACVDYSDSSREALEQAAVVAKQEGADLHVIHAYFPIWMHPTDVVYDLSPVHDVEFQERERANMARQLEKFTQPVREAHPGLPVTHAVLERQSVAYAIADYLRDHEADLAVVGSRGRSALTKFLLGTTAERIIHDSPCSVLAIRPEEEE